MWGVGRPSNICGVMGAETGDAGVASCPPVPAAAAVGLSVCPPTHPAHATGMHTGMRVKLQAGAEDGQWVVEEAAVAFGGVAAKVLTAPRLVAALVGQPWDRNTLQASRPGVGRCAWGSGRREVAGRRLPRVHMHV